MPPVTIDDVSEFVAVSERLQDCRDELDDLVERMRRKGDTDRVALLRRASSKLADIRREVDNAL